MSRTAMPPFWREVERARLGPKRLIAHPIISSAVVKRNLYLDCTVWGKGMISCVRDGAGDEIRTRDIDLGKVALYQLSYSRKLA